ncbi:LysR substrate-binding domain-containing protein [Actinacidiphila sp. DG2A-62]|uniref:LysR family transcriptional regulator n=1 Tax=Actinacidiphila sp. DG2A-62 TaxID=3108821 RepID=UPI002DBE66FB|nr:LysR substrate-binding domain-containing protein [Actinacidiphila sp. DG2A-62]MEC3998819.1 LysR substrate-binding domain-containing protein [Actinacidiphila sp. DG2A-62]
MPADVDLRKLRHFVAVAQELHFGRAAERLHLAQPALSRQIRALEDELRVRLFDRDRRSTALTAAGRQLLADAPGLLAAAEGVHRRVRQAADGDGTFTVAFMPGVSVTAPVRALLARRPDLRVELVRTYWDDQALVVRDGRADVSFVRMPVERAGLRLRPLFTEPRVAILPRSHRLASRASLGIADLAAERLLQDPDAVPEWRDLPGRPRPEDGGPPAAPTVRTMEEKLQYVAALRGVVVAPLSAAAHYAGPDVCHVPVDDIAPAQVCLAWSADREDTPLIEDFAELAAASCAQDGARPESQEGQRGAARDGERVAVRDGARDRTQGAARDRAQDGARDGAPAAAEAAGPQA